MEHRSSGVFVSFPPHRQQTMNFSQITPLIYHAIKEKLPLFTFRALGKLEKCPFLARPVRSVPWRRARATAEMGCIFELFVYAKFSQLCAGCMWVSFWCIVFSRPVGFPRLHAVLHFTFFSFITLFAAHLRVAQILFFRSSRWVSLEWFLNHRHW